MALGKTYEEVQEWTSSSNFILMQEWLDDPNNWFNPKVVLRMLVRLIYEVHCCRFMFGGKPRKEDEFLEDFGLIQKDTSPKTEKCGEITLPTVEDYLNYNKLPPEEKKRRDLASQRAMIRSGITLP